MAKERITLVHRESVGQSDRYTCTVCLGSWYCQNRTAVTTGGLQSARLVRCRIPAATLTEAASAALTDLASGDRIARGTVSVTDGKDFSSLSRRADTAAVLNIHDNRRGVFPHYFIEGAG